MHPPEGAWRERLAACFLQLEAMVLDRTLEISKFHSVVATVLEELIMTVGAVPQRQRICRVVHLLSVAKNVLDLFLGIGSSKEFINQEFTKLPPDAQRTILGLEIDGSDPSVQLFRRHYRIWEVRLQPRYVMVKQDPRLTMENYQIAFVLEMLVDEVARFGKALEPHLVVHEYHRVLRHVWGYTIALLNLKSS